MDPGDFNKILDSKLENLATKDDLKDFATLFEELNGRMEAMEDSLDRISVHRILDMQNRLKKIEKRLSVLSGKIDKTTTKKELADLDTKFDKFFTELDEFGSKTAQKVKHIESHIDIPPFQQAA